MLKRRIPDKEKLKFIEAEQALSDYERGYRETLAGKTIRKNKLKKVIGDVLAGAFSDVGYKQKIKTFEEEKKIIEKDLKDLRQKINDREELVRYTKSRIQDKDDKQFFADHNLRIDNRKQRLEDIKKDVAYLKKGIEPPTKIKDEEATAIAAYPHDTLSMAGTVSDVKVAGPSIEETKEEEAGETDIGMTDDLIPDESGELVLEIPELPHDVKPLPCNQRTKYPNIKINNTGGAAWYFKSGETSYDTLYIPKIAATLREFLMASNVQEQRESVKKQMQRKDGMFKSFSKLLQDNPEAFLDFKAATDQLKSEGITATSEFDNQYLELETIVISKYSKPRHFSMEGDGLKPVRFLGSDEQQLEYWLKVYSEMGNKGPVVRNKIVTLVEEMYDSDDEGYSEIQNLLGF